ncbi:MAG: DUF459 domain-containing protein [Cyanobacteria bacterium J06633_8]
MKDLRFLLIASLGTVILTAINYPLVIKSLGSSQLANNQLKQAAREVKIQGFRKTETDFWNSIKEIEFEDTNQNTKSNTTEKTELFQPEKQPTAESTEVKKQEKPLTRFLLLGDSIMYAFGVEFENAAKKSDFKFDEIKVDFKISTGLNRIDFFDWYARTPQLISKYNPDAVIVIFGGNDDQAILDKDGKFRAELTPEWKAAYQERVERYAKLLNESSVRKVYWVGHPISNVPRYRQFFGIFNEIYQEVSQTYPKIDFVDNWDTFAINNNFSPIVANKSGKKGRVRTKDGYHFTHHGARILADNLIQKMNQDGVLKNTVELKAENIDSANNK